jgi:membrane protein DedA with SNARE-associated domain
VAAQSAESEQRVTPLELFFDLLFVFAIPQVTGFLADHHTWEGLLQGMFLLGALWGARAAYAWLTNTLNPEEGIVRIAVFASMAAMLVVALAAPQAFGSAGIVFGVAYFIVRVLHLVLYAIAGRGDRELMQAVLRIAPSALIGAALLVVAGFTDDGLRMGLWAVALAIDYLWLLVSGMRGWRVSPEHFIERHGRWVRLNRHHLDIADRWFERHGAATVFFTRMLPIVRTFISLPAGVARMGFTRFTIYTLLGCIPWVFMLTFIGKEAGDNWEQWKDNLHYVDYAVAVAIVAGAVYVFFKWRRGKSDAGPGTSTSGKPEAESI